VKYSVRTTCVIIKSKTDVIYIAINIYDGTIQPFPVLY
jgi:hypothetical protein